MDQKIFALLSRLWLKEVDAAILAEVEALPGLLALAAPLNELAMAYTDTFLLNVYPYASVFLDANGEMNGQRARELAEIYHRFGFQPESLAEAGAPDHLGLVLGLLAHVPTPQQAGLLGKYVLDWAPVLCFAIERQPEVHPFYRALAGHTRQALFRAFAREALGVSGPHLTPGEVWIELPLAEPGEEPSLSQVVHDLLCPARSGIFLSRTQLGQWALRLGVPVAFGERYRVGMSLFEAAGMVDRAPELLEWLLAELEAWDAAYVTWAGEHPVWGLFAGEWRERIAATRSSFELARAAIQATPL